MLSFLFVAVIRKCFVEILCLTLWQFGVLYLLVFQAGVSFWDFVFVTVAILCFVGRASIALTHILLLTRSPIAPILIHKLETKFSTRDDT